MKRLLLLFSTLFFITSIQSQTVIWEEQFDGGIPADWEIGPGNPAGAVWQWAEDSQANDADVGGTTINALFWGTRGPIQSPSTANGCAMYNSDVYDGGGIGVGSGMFPGAHSGTLTSPSVDCSAYSSVSLKFNQYARANANAVSTLVELSNDGGMTWTDFPINPTVVGNGGTAPDDVLLINVSSVAANQPDVKVRFTWNGRYYYWLLDDVQFIETPAYNLATTSGFYTPGAYAQPEAVICRDTFSFFGTVSNIGGMDRNDVYLKVTIEDQADGSIVYTDSVGIDVLPSAYADSTLTIEAGFVPDLAVGAYLLRYEAYSLDGNADFDSSDDGMVEEFLVTDNLFSMDDGAGIGGIRPGGGGDYEMGNVYTVPGELCLSDVASFIVTDGYFLAAKNAADGPIGGEQATFFLKRVRDDILGDYSNFDVNSDMSLETIGFGQYDFPADAANYDDNDVPILDALTFTNGVEIDPGSRLFATVRFEGSANTIFMGTDDDIIIDHVSTVVNSSQWFLGGFGPDEAAVARLDLDIAVNTNAPELADNVMSLFPNPTTDRLTVDVALDAPATAMVVVSSIDSKVVAVREFDNLQEEQVEFNVSNLAAGTYIVTLVTEKGFKAQKFVVAK